MRNLFIIIVIFIGITSNAQELFNEYTDIVEYISTHMDEGEYFSEKNFPEITWTEKTDSLLATLYLKDSDGTEYLNVFTEGLKEGSIIFRHIALIPENSKVLNEYISNLDEHYFKSTDNTWYFMVELRRIKVTKEYNKVNKQYSFDYTIDL